MWDPLPWVVHNITWFQLVFSNILSCVIPMIWPQIAYVGGLEQDGSIFMANAPKIPQSCTKPSIWASFHISWGWPGYRSLCDVYEPLSGGILYCEQYSHYRRVVKIYSWFILMHILLFSMVTVLYINYMIRLCHIKALVSGNKLLCNLCRSDTVVSSYSTVKDNLIWHTMSQIQRWNIYHAWTCWPLSEVDVILEM